MQLPLRLETTEQVHKAWAFAVDKRPATRGRRRRKLMDYRNCIITACSKEAKLWGIRAGMRYEEAKLLLPDLRVLVIGGKVHE
jgi:nucleotidyltransferase/DNA polymerase involved in DNA repair